MTPRDRVDSFDGAGWVQRSGLMTRRALFLDLNFWISIADRRTSVDAELYDVLVAHVAAGHLFCPVSPSLIIELSKQRDTPHRERQADFMNLLSLGAGLRMPQDTFSIEFRRALAGEPLERSVAYTHWLDAYSRGLALEWPEGEHRHRENATRGIFAMIEQQRIADILRMVPEDGRASVIQQMREDFQKMCAEEAAARKNDPQTAQQIEDAEFSAVVRSFTVPIAAALISTDPARLRLQLDMGQSDKRAVLEACPSLHVAYKLLAAMRTTKQTLQVNDLWDIEHVSEGLPYVDYVACDGGVRHVCHEFLRHATRFAVRVTSSREELLAWMRSLP